LDREWAVQKCKEVEEYAMKERKTSVSATSYWAGQEHAAVELASKMRDGRPPLGAYPGPWPTAGYAYQDPAPGQCGFVNRPSMQTFSMTYEAGQELLSAMRNSARTFTRTWQSDGEFRTSNICWCHRPGASVCTDWCRSAGERFMALEKLLG